MIQHYYFPCVNIVPKFDYYYEVEILQSNFLERTTFVQIPTAQKCTISKYSHMNYITPTTSLHYFDIIQTSMISYYTFNVSNPCSLYPCCCSQSWLRKVLFIVCINKFRKDVWSSGDLTLHMYAVHCAVFLLHSIYLLGCL